MVPVAFNASWNSRGGAGRRCRQTTILHAVWKSMSMICPDDGGDGEGGSAMLVDSMLPQICQYRSKLKVSHLQGKTLECIGDLRAVALS